MEAVKAFVTQMGVRRLAAMGAVALLLVGLLATMSMKGSDPQMGYLYTDLDPSSAQAITEKLRGQNIPFELSPDGTAVLAPVDQLAQLRMDLASEQIGGKIGYEVIDAEDAFGTSASKAKINQTRAIEGELARSIESLTSVSRARVHIVMPERALFATQSRPASASITLKTSARLSSQQTDAIRHLVASAVPELTPERISIVDQNGTLLARAGDGADATATALEERQVALQNRLREQIETMLERIVGPGHVRAEIAAELDLDEVREESELFDPDRQVVAKSTTVERADESNEKTASGAVSVSTALPENQPGPAQDGDTRRTAGNETSEEITYDNSRTRKTLVRQGGTVKRLTVSVMVDGSYTEGSNGSRSYTPRSKAEIERFTRLVENAIGFNEERGDSVVVENLQFAEPESVDGESDGLIASLGKGDMLDLARTLVFGILGLVGLVIVAKLLLKGGAAKQVETTQLAPPEELPALPPPVSAEMTELVARAAGGDEEAMERLQILRETQSGRPALEHEIAVAQIDGRLKASAIKRVGDVIEKNPVEAAAIVRQWMYS